MYVSVTGNTFVSDFGCFFNSKSSSYKDAIRIPGDKRQGQKLCCGAEESNAQDTTAASPGQQPRLAAPASLKPRHFQHLSGCSEARSQTALPLAGRGSKDLEGGLVPPLPLALLRFTKAKLSTAENPPQRVNHTAWVEVLSHASFRFLHLLEPDVFRRTQGMLYQ